MTKKELEKIFHVGNQRKRVSSRPRKELDLSATQKVGKLEAEGDYDGN